MTEYEIKDLAHYCDVDCIVTDDSCYKITSKLAFEHAISVLNINDYIKDNITFSPEFHYYENECNIILGSSGTSASGKRIVLTQDAILKNVKLHVENLELTSEDIFLVYLPMCFGYCHTTLFLSSLFLGAKLVIGSSKFLAKDFFNLCEKHKVTTFSAVPTHLLLLLEYRGQVDLSKLYLKYICFGGSKLAADNIIKFTKKYSGIALLETYGMTELGPRVTCMDIPNILNKVGSVGKSLKGIDIKIVDENGNTLKENKIGRIYVKSPSRMSGYYKNVEATLAVFKGSWFYTGDVGYLDTDGYLYLVGREKNIIISGGINIYPEEYEQIITTYNHIIEVKVYGIPDEFLGEKIAADIVVDDEFDLCNFKDFCNKRFNLNKLNNINIVDSISKTYTGKIKRWNSGDRSSR